MLWVVVIGVVGLGTVVGYAVWLAHKGADVFSEVRVLGQRLGALEDLVGQVRVPPRPLSAADLRDSGALARTLEAEPDDVG